VPTSFTTEPMWSVQRLIGLRSGGEMWYLMEAERVNGTNGLGTVVGVSTRVDTRPQAPERRDFIPSVNSREARGVFL